MRKLNSKKGSSMVIALVTILIVTLACLSLFMTMSAVTRKAGSSVQMEQARIAAASASQVIQKQIEEGVTVTKDSSGSTGGETYTATVNNQISQYIYDELGNETKTFTLDNPVEFPKSYSKCDLKMTIWKGSEDGASAEGGSSDNTLYVKVTAKVSGVGGAESCSLTSSFDSWELENGMSWWKYSGEMK